MAKEYVQDGILHYRRYLKNLELPTNELIWGYLQQEEVHASMCCGSFQSAIGRVILWTKTGEKLSFQYEGMEKPRKLLDEIAGANPAMAVGYTKENREKFEKNP